MVHIIIPFLREVELLPYTRIHQTPKLYILKSL